MFSEWFDKSNMYILHTLQHREFIQINKYHNTMLYIYLDICSHKVEIEWFIDTPLILRHVLSIH